jgi:hypothetical protein
MMRVELVTDKNASRAMHLPVMDFQVHLASGEQPTAELSALIAVLERSAASAWEIAHDADWTGRSQ